MQSIAILIIAHPITVGVVHKSGRGRKFFARGLLSTPLYKILDTPLDVSIIHLLVLNLLIKFPLGQGKKLDKNIMMNVGGACA